MFTPLIPLLVLQDRDRKIFLLKEELDHIPQEAAQLKSRLTEKMRSLEAAKAAQLHLEKAIKKVELEVATRKETITKLKTRQAETKKNEEYQMLIHEMKRYGAEIEALETQELELMEALDEKKEKRARVLASFEQEKELVTEQSKELVRGKGARTKALEDLQSDRETLALKVEPELLELYQRILSRRGVGAVAEVTTTGQCLGCNIKLPAAAFYRIQAGESLIQCSECSRILYYA